MALCSIDWEDSSSFLHVIYSHMLNLILYQSRKMTEAQLELS